MNCYSDGDDMSIETAKKALEMFEGDILTIGGGEPTIHPKFWEIFGLAMGINIRYELNPMIVTNGSMTDTAIALAALAKSGAISAALSQDAYHDPIDSKVVQAFVKDKPRRYSNDIYTDCREIRNVAGHEINAGRCDFGEDDICPCNDFIVKPNGDVKACGCDDAPILGNINDGTFDSSRWEFECDHCYREMTEVEEIYA
jgi:MoaA/NifB/PqqE/SkfB family radical SAM enzyme